MHLSQHRRSQGGRELNPLKLPPPVSPHTDSELIRSRIVPAPQHRRGALEIRPRIVRVGDDERGGVEGDDRGGGNAEDPLVAAAPGVLDDGVASKVLRLFGGGRGMGEGGAGRIGGMAGGEVHGGELGEVGGALVVTKEGEEEAEATVRGSGRAVAGVGGPQRGRSAGIGRG